VAAYATVSKTHPKVASKETSSKETTVFTIKSGVMPSSTRLVVISQELPWMEEILFKMECNEQPVAHFDCIVRRFYVDLFRVITPSNAP